MMKTPTKGLWHNAYIDPPDVKPFGNITVTQEEIENFAALLDSSQMVILGVILGCQFDVISISAHLTAIAQDRNSLKE